MTAQTFSPPTEQNDEQRQLSMVFKPAPDRSRWEGLAAASWILLIDGALILWLLRRPVDGVSFLLLSAILLSLPFLLHLLYRTWGAFTLEYWLDRDALRIHWAASCTVIPLSAIEQIVRDEALPARWSLRFWPAPFVRFPVNRGGAMWEMFASRPAHESLWLQTAEGFFAISPADPEAFLEMLQTYNRLGPAHALTIGRERPRLCIVSLFDDRLSRWLLLAGLAGVLALFAVLFFTYGSLPDRLIFHYDTARMPDSIRPKSALFLLPALSLTAYLVNTLVGVWMACRKQRTGAYLLWSGTLSVQLFSLFALFSLIR